MGWFSSSSPASSSSRSPSPPALPGPAPAPSSSSGSSDPAKNPLNPQGIKPCCACPETKRARDDCFLRYGPPDEGAESVVKCADLMSAHRTCMASYGFKI